LRFYLPTLEQKIEQESFCRKVILKLPLKSTCAQADLNGNMEQIVAIDENVALLTEDLEKRRMKLEPFPRAPALHVE